MASALALATRSVILGGTRSVCTHSVTYTSKLYRVKRLRMIVETLGQHSSLVSLRESKPKSV